MIELEHELPSTDNLTWITGEPWAAHSIFQDPDNVYLQWRVLVPDDGAGNALLITEHLQGSHVAWDLNGAWSRRAPFEFSNAFNEMEAWWENPIPTTGPGHFIRSLSLNYGYQTALRATIEATINGAAGRVTSNWAAPHTNSLNEELTRPRRLPGHGLQEGAPTAFVLSVSEINHYFTAETNQRAATRVSNLTPFPTAENRWSVRGVVSYNGTDDFPICVTSAGSIAISTTNCGAPATAVNALRPAVWIRLNH